MDRIVLDPGHGGEYAEAGSSPNHASAANGLREKDLALDIANRVSRMLAVEAEVRLTRAMDVNLSLSARARIAREAGAAAFVSLHFNGSPDPHTDGAEAWIARNATPRSRALAENLVAKLADATGAPNRGVRQRNLGVLLLERQSPATAACLLEIAFLTNSRQAGLLVHSDYRDALAAAIAGGLRENLHREATAAQGWSGALGGPKSDKPSDFPKELRVYWADSHERLFHHYWHLARMQWPSLTKAERNDISTFGFSVPPPRLAGDGQTRKAAPGAGLDFLFMHRHMVEATGDFAVARKLKYRPHAWDPIPWDHADPNWPMPVIATAENFKDKSITDYWREKVRNQFHNTKWLQGVELDALGTTVEEGIHGWFHMHWSTEQPADLGDTSVTGDWLGNPFSAAVNPAFWKLHPWVNDLIERWDAAQKAGKTGRSIAAALKGFTPWIGPSLTSPAPAKTHALAEMAHPHHGIEMPLKEIQARIARLDFDQWQPFPFARLSLEQLRRRFGPENETAGPALVAGWDGDDASSLAIAEAQAAKCGNDEAVTGNMALLISDEAPLPVTKAVKDAASADAKLDFHAVCAIVPDDPDPALLVYFHGDREYVTVAAKGNVAADKSGHSRVPRWAPGNKVAEKGVQSKPATAIHEQLDQLGKGQSAVKLPKDVVVPGVKRPVVLVPGAGEPTTDPDHWTTPPPGQYDTDFARMGRLVIDCYEHLRCLKNPSGKTYLPDDCKNVASWAGNLRRVYLAAHSGGGKPASECAASEMMLPGPKSTMGTGGRAADLWLLDATYQFKKSIDRYEAFCKNWKDQKKLAYAAECARMVCIYRKKDSDSDTETGADDLRQRVAKLLGVSAGTLLFRDDTDDMGSKTMLTKVIPALLSSPVVFVRTDVLHKNIPSLFIPLLLRTAAS